MKVKMSHSVAVRGGSLSSGQEVDVAESVAQSLVAAGHATPLDPDDLDALQEPAEDAPGAPEADEPSDAQSEGDEEEPDDPGDDLASMKLPELRELAAERGLPTSGNKPTLIERLRGE